MEQFIYWWNHLPENINPVFFAIGSRSDSVLRIDVFIIILGYLYPHSIPFKKRTNSFLRQINWMIMRHGRFWVY